jgi:hypothetical protein
MLIKTVTMLELWCMLIKTVTMLELWCILIKTVTDHNSNIVTVLINIHIYLNNISYDWANTCFSNYN